MDEADLLIQRAELMALQCEMEGMVAKNKESFVTTKRCPYGIDEFRNIANQMRYIAKYITRYK